MEDGLLKFKGNLYIPCMGDMKKLIFDEFHKIPYSCNLGYQKMINKYENDISLARHKKGCG